MSYLCIAAVIGSVELSLFFYLLNTAYKNSAPAAGTTGKKDYMPVYVSIRIYKADASAGV